MDMKKKIKVSLLTLEFSLKKEKKLIYKKHSEPPLSTKLQLMSLFSLFFPSDNKILYPRAKSFMDLFYPNKETKLFPKRIRKMKLLIDLIEETLE